MLIKILERRSDMANEVLKEALRLSMEKELETFPSNTSLEEYHSFSGEFEQKMKLLIKKANIKYININKFRIRRSIAAASLIIIIAAASMHVEAVRLPVIKLTEKIYTEFSEILFNNEENVAVPETIGDVYVPAYIPEGYTLTEEEDMRLMHFFVYTNEKEQVIYVEQFTLGVSMAVDTEGITTEEITINGMNGIIYSKRGLTTIIVNDNSYVHMISGYESREEIIKIAESLYIRE
jgi:hypothetical protein